MRFRYQEIDVEIGRTKNATGCSLPTSEYVRAELAAVIRDRAAKRIEFDGLTRDGAKQIVLFLLDGQTVRITNWKRDHISRKYYS